MRYAATFFTHFGAIQFHRNCADLHWQARLAPVPRTLSSSCGTCVLFDCPEADPASVIEEKGLAEDAEQIVRALGDSWEILWKAADL